MSFVIFVKVRVALVAFIFSFPQLFSNFIKIKDVLSIFHSLNSSISVYILFYQLFLHFIWIIFDLSAFKSNCFLKILLYMFIYFVSFSILLHLTLN